MKEEWLIETIGLTRVYGKGEAAVHALRGIDLRVRRGEFLAVMGPSGSGKSTLMNILGCLDRPTSGTYILDGQDVSHLNRNELARIRNEKIGFIFQSYNLLPRLTALRNVTLPLLYNTPPVREREQVERATEMLARVGLSERLHHRPNELSGGQQQRVAIARALINAPQLILADEPTGNLDTRSGAEIMEILHQLHAQGVTIILVTHDPSISAHAERVIHLLDGRIVEEKHNSIHPVGIISRPGGAS